MMDELNQFISPDMQKILSFVLPAFAALAILVMNLSRGFSIPGKAAMVLFAAIAVYFFPNFMEVF